MSTAVLIIAKDNLRGFQQALHSWFSVKNVEEAHFVLILELSDLTQHMLEEFGEFIHHRNLTRHEVILFRDAMPYEERLRSQLDRLFNVGFDEVWEAGEDEVVPEDVLIS
jgi:hypothetical protein